jgi:hypothetical protein
MNPYPVRPVLARYLLLASDFSIENNGRVVHADYIAVVKNMFRLTSQIIRKSLRAERSNLSGVPKDGFVVRLRRTPHNDRLSEPIFASHYKHLCREWDR